MWPVRQTRERTAMKYVPIQRMSDDGQAKLQGDAVPQGHRALSADTVDGHT